MVIVVAVAALIDAVVPDLLSAGEDVGPLVVAVLAAAPDRLVSVSVSVVVRAAVAVLIDAVVPDLVAIRVDRGGEVITVLIDAEPVTVLIVIVAVTVLIRAVIPDLICARVHVRARVVAVGAAGSDRVEAVGVRVVV